MRDKKKILVIGGPTASGKSGLALTLAQQLKSTIINADSIQLYDGLPILTAQPTTQDRTKAPHKLYGTLAPDEQTDVATWKDMALAEIEKTKSLPIIVGGTGFYLKTLVEGISPVPNVPEDIQTALIQKHKDIGSDAFYTELKQRDPVMAEKLHPANTQRVIRAMAVLEATGKSLADFQALPPVPPPEHLQFITVTLLPGREILYDRCNRRFEWMIQNGALEEAATFRKRIKTATPLTKALGFRQICRYLDDEMTLEEATEKAQQDTRHYAKRQTTWFRNQVVPDLALHRPEAETVIKYLEEKREIC